MKLTRFAVVLASIFALFTVEAFAQVGSVLGKLVDDQGNPIAGAECTIEKSGGGRKVKVKTKDNGSFVRAGLRVGTYSIRCEKDGYRPLPLQVPVAASGQGDLGEQVMFPLAAGELSESDHARATELLSGVTEAAESGDDAATLQNLMELHELMPESTEVVFNIASTHEKMGNTEKALEYYAQSAETPSLAYDSYLAIGDIRGKAREWAPAAEAMKKAMDIKAVDPVAMFNYAVYAQNAGDVDAATAAFEKTIEIDPNRALAYYQLGLISVGKAENDVALAHFDKFLTLAPDHPQAAAAQGVIDALNAAETNK